MAKYPRETDLNDIVKMMRSSERLQSLCEQRRELLVKEKRVDADRIKKKMIPAFCPGAFLFDGKGRNNVIGLTDLCFLETDHISEKQISKAMELLRKDCHIVLCLRSISGDGLHFIIRYKFKNMEQPSYHNMGKNRMNHTYGAVFMSLKKYYQGMLGVHIDSSVFLNVVFRLGERRCQVEFLKELSSHSKEFHAASLPRVRYLNLNDVADLTGPGGHDDYPVRQVDRFIYVMCNEHHRDAV